MAKDGMAKKSFTNAKYGYGTIGVEVFFSIADIYRLKDTIANIQKGDSAREVALRGLMNLHNKLVDALDNTGDSLFNIGADCYEIDNSDIKL